MSKAGISEIDRLIELASAERPRTAVATAMPRIGDHSLSLEEQKDPRPSMWRVLIQLRALLPYLARLLPLLERGVLGTNVLGGAATAQHRLDTTHFDDGVSGIADAHKDLSVQLKSQASEIKFLQEQVGWLSKSLEKDGVQREELAVTIKSLRKLIVAWGVIGTILLAALIAIVFLGSAHLK